MPPAALPRPASRRSAPGTARKKQVRREGRMEETADERRRADRKPNRTRNELRTQNQELSWALELFEPGELARQELAGHVAVGGVVVAPEGAEVRLDAAAREAAREVGEGDRALRLGMALQE